MNSTLYEKLKLDNVSDLMTAPMNCIQATTFQRYADTEWRPTSQAKDALLEYLGTPLSPLEKISFYLSYSFSRNYNAQYASSIKGITQEINNETKTELRAALAQCGTFRKVLQSFYKKAIRWIENGDGVHEPQRAAEFYANAESYLTKTILKLKELGLKDSIDVSKDVEFCEKLQREIHSRQGMAKREKL